ncbi:hypothetical protein PV08_03138 [Exophiala spinifera]|uniref:Vacuolar protein sorting-associated protein 62 n=1 Tax=Exophiala spinifera TaxID=91928 RepID=A0A0D2C5I7_9EURO|nr:uncharacterized protein PV08_03138 [Exophiala spinifera]KIW18849.1 hypothetical protein PV08_03138 [Exophiala spinifera]
MAHQAMYRYISVLSALILIRFTQVSVSISVAPAYVKKHAPIIWLHSEDTFMPSDIRNHVLHTTPYISFKPVPDSPALDLNNLSSLNQLSKDMFLTAVENVTSMPDWLLGETPDTKGALHNSTACAVVVVEKSDSVTDAFYFYFYSFDEGADITQVVPPLNKILPDAKPGDHFGNHVGDWEHNMIRFKDGEPYGIWFSQHGSGEVCLWEDKACLSKEGDRPIVYSARGSHANYPTAGSHVHDSALIDVADKGRIWDPVSPGWFYSYDPASHLFVALEPESAPTDWLYFDGGWGDKQYPDDDPRQSTVPYFGLKKYNSGPTGPKFKHLVRKGVEPDEKPKSSLLKSAVEFYMSMYGCCLQGINPWVVVISLLIVLAVIIGLLVFTVKRLMPVVQRHLFTREAEKDSDGLLSRMRDWISRKKRRPRDQSEFSLRLLGPERPEDEV